MRSGKDIRKVECKVAIFGWEWIDTKEMTFEEASEIAQRAIDEEPLAMGIKISVLSSYSLSKWIEEFSGDREFNYIGVEL